MRPETNMKDRPIVDFSGEQPIAARILGCKTGDQENVLQSQFGGGQAGCIEL